MSKQKSTRLSPYEMLYGCRPFLPAEDRPRKEAIILLDFNEDQAADYVRVRGELLKQKCAIAFENLRVAQHRDTLRYQQVRSGAHQPSSTVFRTGDLVCVRMRRNVINTLHSIAKPGVHIVVQARESGVLIL
jgi:hypothetical protein